jgi:DNA replication and repair protein RecF
MLALKLAEIEWMKTRTGQWPVLLLDEVLVELDGQRRQDLLACLDRVEQAVLTTTDLQSFAPDFIEKAEVWQVEGGEVRKKEVEGSED